MDKKYDKATSICFQIIEQGHTECLEAINTWILCCGTLARPLEAQGKDEEMVMLLRSIKSDIASKRNRKGGDYLDWVGLAEQWESRGNPQWAYLCYVRALRKCKENKELQRAKALCCLRMGKNYKYLNIMKNKVLKSPISEDFLQDVFQTANVYKESKKPESACEILEMAFNDTKNGKVAFQLFSALEGINDYEKIVTIYESHLQVLKATELAQELEIMYLIALVNTTGSVSAKELSKKVLAVARNIDSKHVNIAAKLAEQLKVHRLNFEAECVYAKLVEFPSSPFFPQYIVLLKEMGEYKKALREIQQWKKERTDDLAQIMKHEIEISSQLMKAKAESNGREDCAKPVRERVSASKRALRESYSARRFGSKVVKVEESEVAEDDKEMQAVDDSVSDPNLIKLVERLLSEWNTEKIKGKHDLNKIKELCKIMDAFLEQEAYSFVHFS
eukprot:TRINITY_DN3568_c0_g5_i7.p1 TRINITY_DN3568_c0_g5~~TRINITY_DN3568_c0_g5_i7.p1  ORF type:complete len:447 (+),score=136.42 TRINITY_DN3568_c0_g5_i7:397-1737(+)